MIVGTGVDVVTHADVRESWQRWNVPWLKKWCAEDEIADLLEVPQVLDRRVTRIAGTLAIKEAVTKALAPASDRPWPWHHIHVSRDLVAARWAVSLQGAALDLSRHLQVTSWMLDVTRGHTHTFAFAVASSDPDGQDQRCERFLS